MKKYLQGKRIDRPTSQEWVRLRDKEKNKMFMEIYNG